MNRHNTFHIFSVTLAKRQQQQQRIDQQFNFKVGNKTFVLVYTVPGVSSDQAREWCQKLRTMVDIDAEGWPIYLRGDLPSSNETYTKMGKVPSKQTNIYYIFQFQWASELEEFKYILMYIEYAKIKGNASGRKLLASPQESNPENEAGTCFYYIG